MSRFTVKNVVKLVVALLFSLFVSFYVLAIGLGAKNKKVILEGMVYAAAFSIGVGGPVSFLLVGSMGISVVRCYMLRDLWLPKGQQQRPVAAPSVHWDTPAVPSRVNVQTQVPKTLTPSAQPQRVHAATVQSSDNLSSALTWVSATAKQNKHRFPDTAYVTVLETCQTLDSIVDAEARQPSNDPSFEYELAALIRQYLPTVLKGYLAVPPDMLNNQQPNGKTPNQELIEQLDLLSGQADALHALRYGDTSAELTSMGNFLRERYGHRQQNGFDFGIE